MYGPEPSHAQMHSLYRHVQELFTDDSNHAVLPQSYIQYVSCLVLICSGVRGPGAVSIFANQIRTSMNQGTHTGQVS